MNAVTDDVSFYGTENILALFLSQQYFSGVGRRDHLATLFHHRWAVPILAELHRRQGERYAVLAHRLGISRETLSQTLEYLIRHGLVRRNPGYGHPLRPEYILSSKGEALGHDCVRLCDRLSELHQEDVGLRKWTMPLIRALSQRGKSMRFSELAGAFSGLTPRALSDSLKRMEEAGLIAREVTTDFPPATRYSLSTTGSRYAGILESLAEELK